MARARGAAAVAVWLALGGCGGAHAGAEPRAGGGAAAGSAGSAGTTSGARVAVDGGAAQDAGAPDAAGAQAGFSAASGPRAREASQHVMAGSAAFGRDDFPTAAREFRAAYELDSSPQMAFNLARVYERMGEVTEAVRFFDVVLHANPPDEQRADIERRVAALRAYEQRRREGIAQPPASADELSAEGARWFRNGVQLYRRRQYSQALLAFQQAYQYLQTPELLFNLASAHERLRHYDQAVEFLREYQQQRRGTPEEAEIQRHIDELERRE